MVWFPDYRLKDLLDLFVCQVFTALDIWMHVGYEDDYRVVYHMQIPLCNRGFKYHVNCVLA